MRRRRRDSVAIPEQFARFVPSEWPGYPDRALAARQWGDAVLAWCEETRDADGYSPLGDFIDEIKHTLRGRRAAQTPYTPKEN